MRIVHGQENEALNTKEQAALNTESEYIHPSNITSDNQILVVPSALLNTLNDHVHETTENSSSTQVENT